MLDKYDVIKKITYRVRINKDDDGGGGSGN